MAYKSFKPYTPGRRQMTVSTFEEITTDKPEKSLLAPVHNHGGRNGSGKMTVRHQGGGHKRQYRIIDFKRMKDNVPATVATIEYDPNRTCRIALLHYADGEKRYILAPKGLKVGDIVTSGPESDIKIGNCLPLINIPLGTVVHNVELKIGKGGQMVRSAGASAQLMAKEGDHALPHGGGEGKSPVGRKRPVTPWGKPAYGVKTRDNKKASTKLIVKRRK